MGPRYINIIRNNSYPRFVIRKKLLKKSIFNFVARLKRKFKNLYLLKIMLFVGNRMTVLTKYLFKLLRKSHSLKADGNLKNLYTLQITMGLQTCKIK